MTAPDRVTSPASAAEETRSRSVVCSLFEGHYHLGFAALANSLVDTGFTGKIYAGIRGPFPPWSEGRRQVLSDGIETMPCGSAEIVFVRVETFRSLTNYKPDFMLRVWDELAPETERMFFFDADIIALARFSYFEAWADAGVALVMDGNTPLPINHPLRVAWHRFFEPRGFRFAARHDYHFNGGFIGVSRQNKGALVSWRDIQIHMDPVVPLNLGVGLPGAPAHMRDRLFPFFLGDQDALNVMTGLENVTLSPMGSEGMGWKIPPVFMLHALGSPKPWIGNYLRQAMRGHAPKDMDVTFWTKFEKPIPVFPAAHVRKIRRHMKWARVLAPPARWLQGVKTLFSRTA